MANAPAPRRILGLAISAAGLLAIVFGGLQAADLRSRLGPPAHTLRTLDHSASRNRVEAVRIAPVSLAHEAHRILDDRTQALVPAAHSAVGMRPLTPGLTVRRP